MEEKVDIVALGELQIAEDEAEIIRLIYDKFQPSAFSLAEGRFCLTVIAHPLIALQRCILLRCHTSCRGSATPAEEIPELSAGQAER